MFHRCWQCVWGQPAHVQAQRIAKSTFTSTSAAALLDAAFNAALPAVESLVMAHGIVEMNRSLRFLDAGRFIEKKAEQERRRSCRRDAGFR